MPKRVEPADIFFVKYTFEVQAMSTVALVAEFTIGPLIDDDDSMLIIVRKTLQRIIERKTSALAGSMTKEAIFKDAKEFLQKVFDKVQLELKQFGLQIYDAKVKQLVDDQKTQMEAADQAGSLLMDQRQVAKLHPAPSTVAFTHAIDVDGDPVAAVVGTTAGAAGPAAAVAAAGPTAVVATTGPVVATGPTAAIAAAGHVATGPAVAAGPTAAIAAAGPAAAAGHVAAAPAVATVVAAAAAGHATAGPAVVVAAAAGHAAIGPIIAAFAAGCCIIM